MVETLADGKLVHVDNAAHMVFEDNPDGFNAVLVRVPGIAALSIPISKVPSPLMGEG